LFQEPFNYFRKDETASDGYRLITER
jgi:hypothetical protein